MIKRSKNEYKISLITYAVIQLLRTKLIKVKSYKLCEARGLYEELLKKGVKTRTVRI
jgi:hypothetical protein